MKDTMWRYFYLEDPIKIQTWLEDLSLEGWKLEKIRYNFGQFRRTAPHRIRYRLEPTERLWEDKPLGYYEEKDRLYADMGWHLVGKAKWNMCYIYYTEDPNAPELHTDSDIQKELWRRMRRRVLQWNLLLLIVALSKVLPILDRLFWSDGDMAPYDLARVRWNTVLNGIMWVIILILCIWRGRRMWRPYRQLQKGNSEPYGIYSASFWSRWHMWIIFLVVYVLSISITSGVWGTFGGTDAFPMDYFSYGYGELPEDEEYLYIDAESLNVQHDADSEMYFYSVRANTFTTVYCSDISQTISDQNSQRVTVETEYFHMRKPYFTRLLMEKILTAATAVEEFHCPGTDGAWMGTDDNDNAFLLVQRDNQAVRFSCDKEVDLTPYMGAVVDLLDRAVY